MRSLHPFLAAALLGHLRMTPHHRCSATSTMAPQVPVLSPHQGVQSNSHLSHHPVAQTVHRQPPTPTPVDHRHPALQQVASNPTQQQPPKPHIKDSNTQPSGSTCHKAPLMDHDNLQRDQITNRACLPCHSRTNARNSGVVAGNAHLRFLKTMGLCWVVGALEPMPSLFVHG